MFAQVFSRHSLLVIIAVLAFQNLVSGQQIQWRADFQAAKAEAQKSGKLVLMHFHADWCRPCQEVESFVFSNPSIQREFKNTVIPVKVDVDLHPELVKQFGVEGIPADVIVTPNERIVKKQESPKETSNYLAMLKDIANMNRLVNTDNDQLAKSLETLRMNWEASQQSPSNALDLVEIPNRDLTKPLAPSTQLANNNSDQSSPVSANGFSGDLEKKSTDSTVTTKPPMSLEPQSKQQLIANQFASNGDFETSASKTQPSAPAVKVSAPKTSSSVNEFVSAESSPTQQQPQLPEAKTDHPITPVMPHELVGKDPGVLTPNDLGVPQKSEIQLKAVARPKSEPAISFALDGDCPVSLLKEGRWVAGDKRFGCVHRGKTYLFASEEFQKLFMDSPDDFSPMLAGYDPVIFHEQGNFVTGDRKFGVFMSKNEKQIVVLFKDETTQKKFKEQPQVFLDAVRVATQRADAGTLTR